MKLNLGCGYNQPEGYVHVDSRHECKPTVRFDLERFPWPWKANSVTEVVFNHSLEHMGQETRVFLRIVQELYHICQDGAKISITVPHPRHDSFLFDPTHVRPITPEGLSLFDRDLNALWAIQKASNTPLGLYLGVDFAVENVVVVLDERYANDFNSGVLTQEQVEILAKERNNVIMEYQITLKVRKPPQLAAA